MDAGGRCGEAKKGWLPGDCMCVPGIFLVPLATRVSCTVTALVTGNKKKNGGQVAGCVTQNRAVTDETNDVAGRLFFLSQNDGESSLERVVGCEMRTAER